MYWIARADCDESVGDSCSEMGPLPGDSEACPIEPISPEKVCVG
jgi:hypothetical protein